MKATFPRDGGVEVGYQWMMYVAYYFGWLVDGKKRRLEIELRSVHLRQRNGNDREEGKRGAFFVLKRTPIVTGLR